MFSVKHDQDEDQQAFLPKADDDNQLAEKGSRKATTASIHYLRLVLEIMMAFGIVILIVHPFPGIKAFKSSPVPEFPLKTYTFLENPRYLNEGMFASQHDTLTTLHNWIELSADGRGYVKIDDWKKFHLPQPYDMKVNDTYSDPVYMVSVYHQLHCLSYLVQHYQTELDQEVTHHSAHCFDYIRQSIMCAADTTLEGKTESSPGWGSQHECKDYDAVLAWANKHDVFKWKKNMPGEAVL